MLNYEPLIKKLDESDQDVFWQGKSSLTAIDKLETLLGSKLPKSFREFLANYGGGGVSEEEISGIEEDNPTLERRGTVYGDTLRCRKEYSLPENLVVMYFGMDSVVWCFDVEHFDGDECSVVSFDVFDKSIKRLAPNFELFFVEYLNLRLNR